MRHQVIIQNADFDLDTELALLKQQDHRVGAVCVFIGTVRDQNDAAAVVGLELEHYPGMTERTIASIQQNASARFDILASRIIHRVGKLQPGDQIVMVAVVSVHRGAGFQACEYLIDYLKTEAPFWKKELTDQGARWVDARDSDAAALRRWV